MGAVVQLAARRGAQPVQDGRRAFDMLPRGGKKFGRRYFYALGFTNGRTKIGITYTPRQRICQHWVSADGGVAWAHVFGPVCGRGAEAIERRVMTLAGEISERIGRTETFRGLSRDDAIHCVRSVLDTARKAAA